MKRVSIERCIDYDENNLKTAIKKSFSNLGGIENIIKPGMKVALKPNLIMRKTPKCAATTHPAFIKAVSDLIIEMGAEPTIIESPGGFYSENHLKSVYSTCGLMKVAEETDLKLNYDIEEIDFKNPEAKLLKTVTLIKPLVDADIIINLPKLKAHGQMAYTGAVKNMFGAVPGIKKVEYHMKMSNYEDFADAIIDIFLSVKPKLSIMDAVIGMEGEGPTSGDPRQIGLILASEDAFALDFTALTLVSADPEGVPVINNGIKRKLCPENIDEIEIVGEKLGDVTLKSFKLPQIDSLKTIQFFNKWPMKHFIKLLKPKPVFIHDLCSGCENCSKNCPAKIIEIRENRPYADLSKCISCFCCQELCPMNAIRIRRSVLSRILIKKNKNKR
ncbi:MAG: DUF362 domain-containing protein [Clostridia bacterium]